MLTLALAAALVVSLLSGALSAMRLHEPPLASAIRGVPRIRNQRGRFLGGFSMEGWLVITQVALALVLVGSASLLLHSLAKLLTVDVGFTTRGLVGVEYARVARFDPTQSFTNQFLEEAARLPGVRTES